MHVQCRADNHVSAGISFLPARSIFPFDHLVSMVTTRTYDYPTYDERWMFHLQPDKLSSPKYTLPQVKSALNKWLWFQVNNVPTWMTREAKIGPRSQWIKPEIRASAAIGSRQSQSGGTCKNWNIKWPKIAIHMLICTHLLSAFEPLVYVCIADVRYECAHMHVNPNPPLQIQNVNNFLSMVC